MCGCSNGSRRDARLGGERSLQISLAELLFLLSPSLSLSFPVGIVDEGGRCSVSAGAKLLFVGFEPERLHFTLPRGMDKEAYNRGRERGERERERDGES